ncbi:hypothetical protein R1flu_019983 [Riccia fluitans]|uniref:Exportin-T n=1 Tax=Riccia fluitans TaxID=41844 RepID=A0ABD1ZK70_9MARC
MDDFERAIFFSFDQSGAVDAQLRAQARAYCEQAKQSPTIWQACLEKFRLSQYPEVQFWCLQALEEVTRQRYRSMDPQERQFIRSSLLAAMCNYDVEDQATASPGSLGSRTNFVKNKLAQIIVILIGIDYPAEWPSVFLDILSQLSKGPTVVDMFCRVLNTLDEEVISLDFPRTAGEVAAATRVKDAMRQQCISQIVGAWYSLAVMYRAQMPYLAASVLDTMHRYVAWIDIGLVANDSIVPLLFELLLSPAEVPILRGAAADCLLAIASKRMEATSKLALLEKLHVGEVCSRITETQEPEFAMKLTALLTGLATEILDCSKKLYSQPKSSQTTAALEAVSVMLDEVLPSVLYFMQHGDEDMSSTTFQFLSNYVARMKSELERNGKQAAHVAQILEVIRNRMLYDSSSKDSLEGPDKEGLEEEERLMDFRKDLFGLFRSIYRVSPLVAKSFVQSALLTALSNPDTSFENVEAAIALLHLLGEGLVEYELKSEKGILGEMIRALLAATVPCHSHRVVALIYLETITRFVHFVQWHPEYIPSVLAAFLDCRGLHHPNPSVSSRASYLFMRLVKVLRAQLVPYIEDIFQSLQDTLSAVTSKGIDGKGDADDRCYAFEAAGLLIGMEDIIEEKQLKYVSALVVPLCTQVDALLSSEASRGDPVGPPATVMNLQQLILAISHLSKGFGEHLVTTSRPSIGNMFKQTVDVVLRVLVVFPKNKVLRSRVISFLHRMVDVLGSAVFPVLPVAIQQLLTDSEPKDLVEFILLFNQLVNKFKVGMSTILQQVFPSVVGRVFALLPKEGLPEGPGTNTEEVRELQELHRCFFTFLHAIISNDLSSVLITPENSQWLPDISQLILDASCQHKDVLVRKICVQIFTRLIADWCGGSGMDEKVPGFRRFVVERFASECCIYSVLQTSFDLRDANTFSLLGEIVTAQKMLYEKCGEEFWVHLATKLLPAVHCPPNMAEQYCLHIQKSDSKDLKAFYKPFIENLRPQQNGDDAAVVISAVHCDACPHLQQFIFSMHAGGCTSARRDPYFAHEFGRKKRKRFLAHHRTLMEVASFIFSVT